ncbi:hypothetical protein D0T53_03790 [Dysgonomonas sp. 216]|nr:hypothetical protein [Dysgonomonas sp. 216]
MSAQVTIGSETVPEKAALLDIKTRSGGAGLTSSDGGGLLMPRVSISDLSVLGIFSDITGLDNNDEKLKHRGLTVYNIGTTNVEAGIYVWDGAKWQKAGQKREIKFFYMPSIQIDLSQNPQPIDLHARYVDQFQHPKASSTGSVIPYYVNASDLDYYITDYDEDIFASVTVDATGEMVYTLQNPLPADVCCSFINIVFVVK